MRDCYLVEQSECQLGLRMSLPQSERICALSSSMYPSSTAEADTFGYSARIQNFALHESAKSMEPARFTSQGVFPFVRSLLYRLPGPL
jgi:hypothetical protein